MSSIHATVGCLQFPLTEMYLILDFVPNHTSWKHQWFEASVKKQGCYTDYYVWKDGKLNESGKVETPNNWKTVFGIKFYLHIKV